VRFWEGYKGSSFVELLGEEHPQLRPDFGSLISASGELPPTAHGTTVLGMRFREGALVAGDRLATMGYQVASREIQKVYATDDYSLMAIAGAAGPAIEMARVLSVELEHYEKIEGERLELDGKANKLSQMIRQNLPAAMQGLAVVPLFAGYDLRRRVGRLWQYDITGGRYEEGNAETSGSGGLYAQEHIKKTWREGMTGQDALDVAIGAIAAAADEDRATGGVDLDRGIFPIVNVCTEAGITRATDDEVRASYERVRS